MSRATLEAAKDWRKWLLFLNLGPTPKLKQKCRVCGASVTQ